MTIEPHLRAPREFVAEELQVEPDRAWRARGCTLPLLSGFFVTLAIGMCMPGVSAAVLGVGL